MRPFKNQRSERSSGWRYSIAPSEVAGAGISYRLLSEPVVGDDRVPRITVIRERIGR
jgi:hypothetical protein